MGSLQAKAKSSDTLHNWLAVQLDKVLLLQERHDAVGGQVQLDDRHSL